MISESSENAKPRFLDISKKVSIRGKSYDNIMCFAILSVGNPDTGGDIPIARNKCKKELFGLLKQNHYTFVGLDGCFDGNVEHSYIIFNITQGTTAKLAGKFQQASFFYCYPDGDGNLVNECWAKQDTEQPYNSVKNPYVFINRTINDKYSIDASVFVKADTALQESIENLRTEFNLIEESNDEILDCIYNKADVKSRTFRHITLKKVNLE